MIKTPVTSAKNEVRNFLKMNIFEIAVFAFPKQTCHLSFFFPLLLFVSTMRVLSKFGN